MSFFVCGLRHQLSSNCNHSTKLEVGEMVFVTKSTGKWVVYPVKLVSHEKLLGLAWNESGVGSSWSGTSERGKEARLTLEARLCECKPLKTRSLSQYQSQVSSEVQ